MLHWWLIDDLYNADEYGSNILVHMSGVPKFNRWMADVIRPYIGARVLEVGAGLGSLTQSLLPRDRYTVSDVNPYYLDYLRNFATGKPYMAVERVDLSNAGDFESLKGRYDTVICLNVLEHLADEAGALANLRATLEPGGRAVILVPQDPALYGTLDEVLGHERRYTRQSFEEALKGANFEVEKIFDFNRVTTPAWRFNGQVLKRKHFSKLQLKIVNTMTWLFRRVDDLLPWEGASLSAVARKTD
jgi:2-polyprenyl-3-methyl-5-hydroxy-6-metoxy-1,4-benzoquinol methylase